NALVPNFSNSIPFKPYCYKEVQDLKATIEQERIQRRLAIFVEKETAGAYVRIWISNNAGLPAMIQCLAGSSSRLPRGAPADGLSRWVGKRNPRYRLGSGIMVSELCLRTRSKGFDKGRRRVDRYTNDSEKPDSDDFKTKPIENSFSR
ncbi:hypothetical protein AVEN_209993-2-1, partial [Araneus ventricosus]